MRDRHDPRGRLLHGRFALREVLRADAGGTVWSATDERTGDPARVTVLRADRRRAHRGGAAHARRMLAVVRTPAVAPVLDASSPDEIDQWIATAAPQGRPLDVLLAEGPLPPQRAAAAIADVAVGLALLHGLGIQHGELQPSSVVVRADGSACLVDAAAALAARPSRGAHARRRRGADPDALRAADVAALGALLAAALGDDADPLASDPPQRATALLAEAGALDAADPDAAHRIALALRQAAEDPGTVRLLAPPLIAATGPVPVAPLEAGTPPPSTARVAAIAVGVAAVAVGGLVVVQLSAADMPAAVPGGEGAGSPVATATGSTSLPSTPSTASSSSSPSSPAASRTSSAPRSSAAGGSSTVGSTTDEPRSTTSQPSPSRSSSRKKSKRPSPTRTSSPKPTTPAPTASPTTPAPTTPAPTSTPTPEPTTPAPTSTPQPTTPAPQPTTEPTAAPTSAPPSSTPTATPEPTATSAPPSEPAPSPTASDG